MVQMAAIDHLARLRIGARYRCRHNCPVPRPHLRLDMRAKRHRPPTGKLRPQRRCRSAGHHKGKPVWLQGIQMTPAHYRRVQARPCRRLVRHVAHDPRRPVLHHGYPLHRRQRTIGQHDLSSYVLAGVVRLAGPRANVDQGRVHVRTVAVIRQPDRVCRPVAQQRVLRLEFPQARRLHMPPQIGAHQPVVNLAIDRKLLRVRALQPILFSARQHELRRLVEFRRPRNPVQPRQAAQVLTRSQTARLFAHQRPLRLTKERLLGIEKAALKNRP